MSIESFDHTADVGVRIEAENPAELMREAARAFLAVLLEGDAGEWSDSSRQERRVELTAPDSESLLVDFLNELIYLFDSQRLIFPELIVEEANFGAGAVLRGRLRGGPWDPRRHKLRTQLKAATYHGLEIRRTERGLSVEVIFDL